MLARALVIVALISQPLSALGLLGPDTVPARCGTSTCCVVVERVGCCGQVVEETVCRHTGGACRCVAPIEDKPQRPEAPPTNRERELFQATPPAGVSIVAWGPAPGGRRPNAGPGSSLFARHTHNGNQAFLGVWRT